MQLGCTMSERMEYVNGQLTNGSLADYKIPGMRDMPEVMESDFVEGYQSGGPHGAKGVGETSTFGVSPAITNAIHDAVGVRLTALPVTAEAVYRAMRVNHNDPLKDA
jgi:CO/xanthine dehydrogenase Mo-binding subunit